MNSKDRLKELKEAPFTWKERDLLTAAEKYMGGEIELPLVEYIIPSFPNIDIQIASKISQIWSYYIAAFQLQSIEVVNKIESSGQNNQTEQNLLKAARIYELEAQRILGSIFPLQSTFWKVFYTRQEEEGSLLLVAIDAMHYSTACQHQIPYQLLLQCLKSITSGHRAPLESKKLYFQNAKRLLIDLPLTSFRNWLNHEVKNIAQKLISTNHI